MHILNIAHTYLQINSQRIRLASLQSLNRVFNYFLCRNEGFWRLKIYRDFLETPGNIGECNQDQEKIGELPRIS